MNIAGDGKEGTTTAAVSAHPRKNRLGLRLGDCILGGAVLLAAVALLLGVGLLSKPGGSAVVVTPAGETALSLSADGDYPFTGKNGIRVVLRIEDGRIRFTESGCPDKVCVHSGWLSRSGQTAACLPAGILVRVEGDPSVDIVAG